MQAEQNKEMDSLLTQIPNEQLKAILKQKMEDVINYTPTIGIMGKSGAGKSSLANAIIGKQLFKTSNTETGTLEPQIEEATIGSRKIRFMDLPGIGDTNAELNDKFYQMYKTAIEKLDVIIWTIRIDDRANNADLTFYKWLIQNYDENRILFVLSQADKVAPSDEWDHSISQPSDEQKETIFQKRMLICRDFNVLMGNVIAVSGIYKKKEDTYKLYNFDQLVGTIIHKVPNKAKSSVYATAAEQNQTEDAKIEAQSGFEKAINEIIDTVIDNSPLPTPIKIIAKEAKKVVIQGAKKLWNKFFG